MSAPRPRVLLVEDVELNRDLVAQILDEEFEILHAADGLDDARMQAFARWTNLSEILRRRLKHLGRASLRSVLKLIKLKQRM